MSSAISGQTLPYTPESGAKLAGPTAFVVGGTTGLAALAAKVGHDATDYAPRPGFTGKKALKATAIATLIMGSLGAHAGFKDKPADGQQGAARGAALGAGLLATGVGADMIRDISRYTNIQSWRTAVSVAGMSIFGAVGIGAIAGAWVGASGSDGGDSKEPTQHEDGTVCP